MAITYTGTLDTNLDRVRFHINDTVDGAGPKPGDVNFTDSELNGLISIEGDWGPAVAAALETLASAWARLPDFQADQLRVNRTDIAEQYRKLAAEWRIRAGTVTMRSRSGWRPVIRIDGYSDDIDNTE